MRLTRNRTILAKIEVTEGTDPVPTGAANAIQCGNITVTPIGGSTSDRALAFPNFGAMPKVHINKQVQVQFDVELAGSGAAGTAPAWGPLVRACRLSETIVAATSVTYAPATTPESVTIYANEDGALHKLVGARGTLSLVFAKDAIPLIRFTFTGRWTPVSAAALPALTLTGWATAPLVMGKVNTPTFTLGGDAAVLEAMQIDLGNTVVHRDRPGAEYVAITDRTVAGNMSFEAPAQGTKDFFALAVANTLMARAIVHGITGGNIISISEPAVQILQPAYADGDGVRLLSMNTQSNRSSGDDEISIAVT